jgi:flagellar hook protein FlgE
MSIYTAMRAGVSGLSANASALAAISDNVANINTTAYKRTVNDFSAMVNGRPGQSLYSAGGVLANVRRSVDVQGSLEQGRGATDLAIQGRGFFVVSPTPQRLVEGGEAMFTRSGAFTVDAAGFMRNPLDFYLQGWPVQRDGSVTSSPTSLSVMQPVNLSNVGGAAEATTRTVFNANLNSSQASYVEDPVQPSLTAPTYVPGMLARSELKPHFETTIEVFDSLGKANTLAIGFLKTGVNSWQVEAYTRPIDAVTAADGMVSSGSVTFGNTGRVETVTGDIAAPFNIEWNPAISGAGTQEMSIALSQGLTQFAIGYGVNSVVTDGAPPGDLIGVSLEENGMLTAQFSNGRTRPIYQIPLATFLNPNGLNAEVNGAYRQTVESGVYTINAPGGGGSGTINSGVLEASNVDLGSEFTNMITTQRAYSASSRIITTADEMLEELLRIKR